MTNESERESSQAVSPGTAASEAGIAAARALGSTMQQADAFIARFSQAARADACVGPVQTMDKHAVVPISTVSMQAGFGMGFGGGSDGSQGQGSGGGGGGGGRGSSRVIAIVDISDEGVSIRPVPDVTSIALALMALLGVAILATRGRPPAGLLRMFRQQQ